MVEFSYTTVPGKIKPLLDKVRQVGVPQRATAQWLKTLGFTSSNDISLITVLKITGLVDQGGTPTPRWSQFRGNHYKSVLGSAIKEGYHTLYDIYPDAHLRGQGDLDHVFRTSTSGGDQVVAKTLATFKALAAEATFAEDDMAPQTHRTDVADVTLSPTPKERADRRATQVAAVPSVHIDIQIHISPESSAEQVDHIFRSMAKHLYTHESN